MQALLFCPFADESSRFDDCFTTSWVYCAIHPKFGPGDCAMA